MKKQWMIKILFLVVSFVSNAQFGIGIKKPHENADIHLANKNRTIILNHVDDKTAITNPQDGMIFYDAVDKCYRGYADGAFTDCFGAKPSDPVVRVDGPGFKGTYVRGELLSDATYEITITNNTFKEVELGFDKSDLLISSLGANTNAGINVVDVYLAGTRPTGLGNVIVKFPAGASKTIVYELSGTPIAPYTQLLGEWSKITMTYDDVVDIEYKFDCNLGSWTIPITPSPLTGLINGTAYNGVYTITTTVDATGYTFQPYSVTKDGLKLESTLVVGTSTTEIVYTLSGTYTGDGTSAMIFELPSGCPLQISLAKNCKEILEYVPTAPSGIYTIDVDGSAFGLEPMDCYCDMTTDGGGWTLVLNYNHLGGTNPPLNGLSNKLPLLSTNSLATSDESILENKKYWGHANFDLFRILDFEEVRFFGISNSVQNAGRKMHFISTSPVVKDIITGKQATTVYDQDDFRLLADHTAYLPRAHNHVGSNSAGSNHFLIGGLFHRTPNVYTWYIGSNRWEVDDNQYNSLNSTHHQVWIR